jgi:hypothetical protein
LLALAAYLAFGAMRAPGAQGDGTRAVGRFHPNSAQRGHLVRGGSVIGVFS